MSKRFNNRENECIKTDDGEIWVSRSVAVVGLVCDLVLAKDHLDQWKFLLCKRGPDCPDEIGKWCLPCGYIDWDEDGLDGFRREVYEETGIFLNLDRWVGVKTDDIRQPWKVNTDPVNSNRQNISMYFSLIRNNRQLDDLPEPDLTKVDLGETEDARWFTAREALELPLAFNHRGVIETFLKR